MRTSWRSRTFAPRLAALSAAVGAAALVGLGTSTAHAAPPPTTATPTTTTTATTTTATTTAASTTATTTAATTSAAPTTTAGPRPAPGPPCPGATSTPFVCIPTGSGEDQPAPVGTAGELEFAAQVVNSGPAVDDASIVITLPASLQLDPESDEPVYRLEQWWSDDSDEDGTPLDCAPNLNAPGITCSTGSIPTGANFLVLVDLVAQDDAVVGTSASFTVALESSPTPGTFPTTSVGATVDFVGTAHLQVSLTPTKASVTVGKSLTLTATIHNVGPNVAVEAAGIGLVFSARISDDQPFMITNSQPLPGEDSGFAAANSAFPRRSLPTRMAAAKMFAGKKSVRKMSALQTFASGTPSSFGYWPIGTIAVGGTALVHIVVKAEYVGQVQLFFGAISADESCVVDDAGCENIATADLTAVAAVTTTATTAGPTTTTTTATATTSTAGVPVSAVVSSGSAAALPNTGFEPTPWLGSAAAIILLGVGLIMLGAPRRRVCGGGHR